MCLFFPANGRNYYHARLMFEHLAQTPEYGPMFISKLWYDGGTDESKNEYPWTAFTRLDPDPTTPLATEWTRMVQRCVTWDFETFKEGEDNPYAADAERGKAEILRYARVLLERVPYDRDWWRPPKEMTPQQLAYNICPLTITAGTVAAELKGYVSAERGSDWRLAFVGVADDGKPVYGDVGRAGETLTFATRSATELYLVVCATPTKILPINMTGDFRSFEQEKFPYRIKLTGCEPRNLLLPEKPTVAGAPHPNGGGFVADSAEAAASAYVGPNARVLGTSKVEGSARIEDCAVVRDATVRDHATVSGHALVSDGAVVQDFAKVRDCGRVMRRAIVKDYAKVLEHGTQDGKACGGYAVVKGVAWSSGNVSGTAMIDGSYRKHNDVDKGRWFTWSWGKGRNPGELDEEFRGLHMQMTFDTPHEWMARDDFAATWGYLVGSPEVREDPASVTYTQTADVVEDVPRFVLPRDPRETNPNSVLVLNGRGQFVELQDDVADMRDISIQVKVNWQGRGDAPILDFSNAAGDSVSLGVTGGKCVFAICRDGKRQALDGPALAPDRWTELLVVLSEDTGRLFVDGAVCARHDRMTWNPDDVRATECYLGRDRQGRHFEGKIDSLEIYSVPLKDDVPPSPDPAQFAVAPIFVNPSTVVMQAVPGIDPLGNVEYLFEETSGNPGGDSSGWLKEPSYQDSGLAAGAGYTYRVKMRDTCGNVTALSAPATVTWKGPAAFTSTDGKTIVVEAENCTRSVPGCLGAKGIEWKLSPRREGCAGTGMMAALPDRGTQIGDAFASESPRLDYLINFPAKGKYAVWMRSWGANPNGDSVYFGLDMKTTKRSLFHTGNGKLQWQRHGDWAIEVDTPGLHTLSVWMREDGCAFDRLVISHDRGLKIERTAGDGPAESPRK